MEPNSGTEAKWGFKPVTTLPLTERCHHYTRREEVPWDIQKYWQQRYSIFEYYDYGIHMTDDAWFGVTPQSIAQEIAWSPHLPDGEVLIDIFAGAGGNAIAFAMSGRWKRIIAIEKDPSVLACAQRNAHIYEVEQYITFVLGDSFQYLEALRNRTAQKLSLENNGQDAIENHDIHIDESLDFLLNDCHPVIFASPPWGGPGYSTAPIFDLSCMEPYNLEKLHYVCRGLPHALYLPRTSDLRQIAALLPNENNSKKIEVVQYCLAGASKAMVAYLPAFGSAS